MLPFAQTRDREMFNDPEPYNHIKSKAVCNADDMAATSPSYNIDRLQTEIQQTCVNLGMLWFRANGFCLNEQKTVRSCSSL